MSVQRSIQSAAFIALAFVATLISGCKSDSTTSTDSGAVTPKPGSSYTYAQHYKDSTNTGVTENDSIIIATVVSSGLTYQGKSNVITLHDGNGTDTLRYVMESNGDVSVYRANFTANVAAAPISFANPTPWMTLPFGSKKTGVALFTAYDTISVNSILIPLVIVGTGDYISPETLVDGTGKKIASGNKAKLTITVTGSYSGIMLNVIVGQTYSFDPTIGGYFASVGTFNLPPVSFFGTTLIQGDQSTKTRILTSFSLIK